MKKIKTIKVLIICAVMISSFFVSQKVLAQDSGNQNGISFPVAALGNCSDQTSCHAYCNVAANISACANFAKEHGLMTASEASTASQYATLLAHGKGPGGCDSADACDAYCSTISNLSTCLNFAQKNGFTTPDLTEGKKVLKYLQSGGQMPGNCTSKASCQTYCSNPSHMDECKQTFKAIGLNINPTGQGGVDNVSPETLQKFNTLVQQGKTPNGCSEFSACEQYCNDPSHGAACTVFTQLMGFDSSMTQNGQVHNNFQGPGGCNSQQSCDAYCSVASHQAECQAVFQKMGNWQGGPQQGQNGSQNSDQQNSNEQTIAGPGGCNSQQSCDAYCSVASHQAECQAVFQKMGNWQGNLQQSQNDTQQQGGTSTETSGQYPTPSSTTGSSTNP
jgi:hypothetical protein